MHKDKRSKGCPNEECARNQEKFRYKANEHFCVECGTRLVYVCRKCFGHLDSDSPSAVLCGHCQAEVEDRNDRVVKAAGAAAAGVAGLVGSAKIAVDRFGPELRRGVAAIMRQVGK